MLAEDVLGFIQKIVHAPDKVGKAVIAIAKAALCVIVAERLFFKFIGPYQLIELDSYSAWHDYIISGCLLICLLLLAFTYFALFEIFGWLTSLILVGFQRKSKPAGFDGIDRKILTYFVNKLKILSIDSKKKEIKPAKHTEVVYEMLVLLNSKEGKNEIETLKESYASKIWHTYIVFVLYYYILYTGTTSFWLSFIIITGAVLLALFYWGSMLVINYLLHKPDKLIKEFEIVRLHAFAEKVFVELGFLTYQIVNPLNPEFETLLNVNGKNYSLVYQFKGGNQIFTEFNLKTVTDYITGTSESVLLLTNLRLTERVQQLIGQFSDSLVVMSFTDEKGLAKQLEDFFFKRL
jgi:hypothetical protein